MRLYFLHMPGCHACESAMPHMKRWERKHPQIPVVYVDLLKVNWTNPWSPEVTPTYVVEEPGRQRVQYPGMLTEQQLDKFIAKAEQMMGIRR
jgi:thiol-disulfide isomerase/thioredoxin